MPLTFDLGLGRIPTAINEILAGKGSMKRQARAEVVLLKLILFYLATDDTHPNSVASRAALVAKQRGANWPEGLGLPKRKYLRAAFKTPLNELMATSHGIVQHLRGRR